MTVHEQAEMLLWDFAKRAQQDEERAYRQAIRFIEASEKVSNERLELLLSRVQ